MLHPFRFGHQTDKREREREDDTSGKVYIHLFFGYNAAGIKTVVDGRGKKKGGIVRDYFVFLLLHACQLAMTKIGITSQRLARSAQSESLFIRRCTCPTYTCPRHRKCSPSIEQNRTKTRWAMINDSVPSLLKFISSILPFAVLCDTTRNSFDFPNVVQCRPVSSSVSGEASRADSSLVWGCASASSTE